MGEKGNCSRVCVSCVSFNSCIKRLAVNDNDAVGIIYLPSDNRLRQRHVPHRLALVLSNLLNVSRHSLPDFASEVIWSYQGLVIDAGGKRIDQTEIDVWDEFDVEADVGLRWYDDLLAWRDAEPKLRPRSSQLRRFRILFLLISIMNPRVAARLL